MLFRGFISNVSKPFALKSSQNKTGMFFTVMKNHEGNSKYIKCLTYSKSLIEDLMISNDNNTIVVESGYPDTSYSREYTNTKTGKEGLYLQHFLVTDAYVEGLHDEPTKEEVLKIVEEPKKEIFREDVKEFDWDWDLDTKENN